MFIGQLPTISPNFLNARRLENVVVDGLKVTGKRSVGCKLLTTLGNTEPNSPMAGKFVNEPVVLA